MRKLATISTVAAIVSALGLAPAIAAPPPGVPGTPNCHGAVIANGVAAFHALGTHGLGNIAKALGVSVKDLHDAVDTFC